LHFALLTFLLETRRQNDYAASTFRATGRDSRYAAASVPRSPPMSSPLTDLAHRMREFVAERDWDQFHSPKNLAMALAGEAGELVAEFQWMTEAQSKAPDAAQMQRIRAEVADVLIYLVRLADKLDIDLIAAAHDKIEANALRYPADKVRGSSKKYDEYG
jgi:NTP pyrophosphatase (non-canonical NTP hydrolase)